jgi:hypothetical protein
MGLGLLAVWDDFPDFGGVTDRDGALFDAFSGVFAVWGLALMAALALFDETGRAALCAVFTAGLPDFVADFVTGLAMLFFACLVFFFALFLLAIAYSTQIHCPGNI